jgi:hypothetical protein
MCDSFAMQVVKSLSDLFKEPPASSFLNLSVSALLLDVLMQTYSFNVVSDYANLFAGFN